MPAIKVIGHNPGGNRRRPTLWECFGKVKVNPIDIKNGKGVHFAIVLQDSFKIALTDEAKEIFAAHQSLLNIMPLGLLLSDI